MDRELAAALGELVVLRLAEPVDFLVGIHAEPGGDGVRFSAGILHGSHFERRVGILGKEARAVRLGERERAGPAVQGHVQRGRLRRDVGVGLSDLDLDFFRLEDDSGRDERRFRAVSRGLGHADDFGRVEDDRGDDAVVHGLESVLFRDFAHVDLLRFKRCCLGFIRTGTHGGRDRESRANGEDEVFHAFAPDVSGWMINETVRIIIMPERKKVNLIFSKK